MRFCTSCGESTRPGTAFCTSCGARTEPGEAATGSPGTTRSTPAGQADPAGPGWADGLPAPAYSGLPYQEAPTVEVARPGNRRGPALLVVGALVLAGGVGFGAITLLQGRGEAVLPAAGAQAAGEGDAEQVADGQPSGPGADAEPAPGPVASKSPDAEPPLPDEAPHRLDPVTVTADCMAPPSQDSVGRTVTYEPERVTDGIPETAWRCTGSAVGERLTLRFPVPVTVTSVGLVPGYDKIDPADGIDRFSQNRTVTAVLWSFDSGLSVLQEVPVPTRDLTRLALDVPVRTTTVIMEITGTGNDNAPRDYTPVSEVEVTGY